MYHHRLAIFQGVSSILLVQVRAQVWTRWWVEIIKSGLGFVWIHKIESVCAFWCFWHVCFVVQCLVLCGFCGCWIVSSTLQSVETHNGDGFIPHGAVGLWW